MRTAAVIILGMIALTLTPAVASMASLAAHLLAAALSASPVVVAAFTAATAATLLGSLWAALGEPPEPQA